VGDQADRLALRRHHKRRRVLLAKADQGQGELRSQFTYVTDIAPTVLQAAGLPFPKSVNGTMQRPLDGTSMAYSFDNAKAKERSRGSHTELH
jgi:arylsulfatase A-like enzyme